MFELMDFSSDRARIDVSRDSAVMRCCMQCVSNNEMSRIVQNKHFFLHAWLYLQCTYFQCESL